MTLSAPSRPLGERETAAILTLARERLGAFTALVSPWWESARHHRRICETLEALERGDIRRLMIFMPPRSGKSELFSVHMPAWWLGRHSDHRIIHASYGAELSNLFSRRVRNLIRDDERYRAIFPGATVAADSQSVSQWEMAHPARGGFRSVGVGSGITGHGADLGIIDDPVKGAEQAYSQVARDGAWNWYLSDFLTRLHPNAAVVIGATRWHVDDLPGRILASGDGPNWTILSLPALSVEGVPLWPERYDAGALDDIRRAVGERTWASLYQQEPTIESGNLFKTEWFEDEWHELPRSIERVITVCDPALKESQQNDEYAWFTGAVGTDGMVYLLNLTHGNYSSYDGAQEAVTIARRLKKAFGHKWQGYCEDTAGGPAMMDNIRRDAPDVTYVPWKAPDKDKVVRANLILPYCEARRVKKPAAHIPWWGAFTDQLLPFPLVKNDDRVDAFITMLEIATSGWRLAASGGGDLGGPTW